MRKISGLSSAACCTFRPAKSAARRAFLWVALLALLPLYPAFSQNIPLPEHPRPDFHRADWLNLNGAWGFAFDSLDVGLRDAWFEGKAAFPHTIQVPFPWGSKLSGVADEADIAWYQRSVSIPSNWTGRRIFLVIGASDWETSVWVDGHKVGTHQGGYTPFSFELTPHVKAGQNSRIYVRVDDKRRDFTLYGKQGYGNARGIWQTTYLEARAAAFLEYVHCTPDIERREVGVEVALDRVPQQDLLVQAEIKTPGGPLKTSFTYPKGARMASARIRLPEQRLWTLEDPYLYDMSVQVGEDRVDTYFGMRKISTVKLPGTDYTYVALNDKPLYLQLTLDQSYHPDGFYTFPSDEFMRNEIQLCKDIGLNGIRTHIKVDIPRKLYWADKLGLLVMSDLPNSWGQPDEAMQAESERTLREMIRRDYNHPSIFSWIVFNETWGLSSKVP
ncbi:MAG: glycoside hydrolase family 2 protein, partial [Haliscomenobacter sp.]